MRLNIADRIRRNAGVAISSAQSFGLALHPRGHRAVAAAVVVETYTADHREHAIAVAQRIFKPLENDHADAFAQDKSIGFVIEWPAGIGSRQCADPAKTNHQVGSADRVNATNNRRIANSGAQMQHRFVHRQQCRRTSCVKHQ